MQLQIERLICIPENSTGYRRSVALSLAGYLLVLQGVLAAGVLAARTVAAGELLTDLMPLWPGLEIGRQPSPIYLHTSLGTIAGVPWCFLADVPNDIVGIKGYGALSLITNAWSLAHVEPFWVIRAHPGDLKKLARP
jgi:hypothetical protein